MRAATGTMQFTYTAVDSKTAVMGIDNVSVYNCAIFVPGKYAGRQITGLAFKINYTPVVSDVKGWVSVARPESGEAADVECRKVEAPQAKDKYNIVNLTEAFTIPEEGCYVGYSLSVSDVKAEPVITDSSCGDISGGMFMMTSADNNAWTDYTGQGDGNLAVVAFIKGELEQNAVSFVNGSFEAVSPRNSFATVTIPVRAEGSKSIRSVSYTVTDPMTGEVSEEKEHVVRNTSVTTGSLGLIPFRIDGSEEPATYGRVITVTKVNGVECTDETGDAVSGKLTVAPMEIRHRVVMEEKTSVGCGYCPRGISAIRLLTELYPEQFIGISIHGNTMGYDPMYCSDYSDILYNYLNGGYPTCTVNRRAITDPYGGISGENLGIKELIEEYLSASVLVGVEVTPEWADFKKGIISVHSDINFAAADERVYKLAYVVLEDGLKGSEAYWNQTNYYNNTNDENLKEWFQRGGKITDMVYDHIPIAAYGILNGIDDFQTQPAEAFTTQSHAYSIDLSGNEVLQDKERLRIVALLIDSETGEIVNAGEGAVPGNPSGNGTEGRVTSDEAYPVARYNSTGQRIGKAEKGINILIMSDGKAIKVFEK